jgi:hypothetical protein
MPRFGFGYRVLTLERKSNRPLVNDPAPGARRRAAFILRSMPTKTLGKRPTTHAPNLPNGV